jgi:hypothetical protein
MYVKLTTKTTKNKAGQEKTYKSFYLTEKRKNPVTNKFEENIIFNLSPRFDIEKPLWRRLCVIISSLLCPDPERYKHILTTRDPRNDRLMPTALRIVEQIKHQETLKLK